MKTSVYCDCDSLNPLGDKKQSQIEKERQKKIKKNYD